MDDTDQGRTRPHVIVHMMSPVDGRVDAARWSPLPGDRDTTDVFEAIHDRLAGDAWMCGRVTMTEFVTGAPHPPADPGRPSRPLGIAPHDARRYAVALDPGGRLHWSAADLDGGEHFVALLGRDVSDAHLAELSADGVSYIVAEGETIDLAAMLATLRRAFGIGRLLVEGGGGMVGSMLAAGLVDEFSLVIVPAIDGTAGARSIVEAGEDGLGDRVRLTLTGHDLLDGGVMWLRYAVAAAD